MGLRLAALLAGVAATGCTLGPDYERPDVETPAQYRERLENAREIINTSWWRSFGDAQLDRLIDVALADSRDLRAATARVAEARARVGFVRADQFPQIDVQAEAGRGNSAELINPGVGARDEYALSAVLAFEVDLFGRLRRATEAERAELLSSESARQAVLLTLVADVASLYFLLLDLDARREIAANTLVVREESTRIIRARFDQGTVPMLDVNQAQIQEADAAAQLAELERLVVQTENTLSVLVGRPPGPVTRQNVFAAGAALPAVPEGLPSELLDRRPDVHAAEMRLAAQTARVGIAEALRWPSLRLTASGGYASSELSDIGDSDAEIWNLAAGLIGPLYNAGRNRRRVDIEVARTEQLLNEYEFTLLNALREVEDALVAVRTLAAENAARERQVEAARNATRLSRARYDGGVTDYLEVLVSENSLLQAEFAASSTARLRLVAIVELYKALGGGWRIPSP